MGEAPLRLALVGCGRQMQTNLLPFLARIDGHEIVACVDEDLAMAAEARARVAGAQAVLSVGALDVSRVDAAVLAVPPEPSSRLTRRLVEQGIDCFVEKPAGPSSDVLESLGRAVRSSGRHVQVGFNFRYAEAFHKLHALTAAARSTPSTVTIDFLSRHPSTPEWGAATTLEAWIRNNGVHAFDLARWFAPAPVTRLDAHAIHSGSDHFLVTVTMRHEDGSLSTLRLGNQTQRFVVGASVQGMDGSRFSAPSLERVTLDMDAGTPSGAVLHSTRNLDHGFSRSGFGPELKAFLAACGQDSSEGGSAPSVADALAASRIADQVLEQLSPAEQDDPRSEGQGERALHGAVNE